MAQGTVLIAGAGHAGFQLAASLRQHGYGERVCLINDEAHLPYQRPPLSKAYLKGAGAPDSLMFRPDKFYREQNIELIADRAVSIDRGARKALLASGASLEYGHLVLATGARNRLLDIPNANLEDVRYLRTLDESEALRQGISSGQRVVVIGAGFIGLEFAAIPPPPETTVSQIEMSGLIESALYDVWGVMLTANGPAPICLGGAPCAFVTDEKGTASFARTLNFCPYRLRAKAMGTTGVAGARPHKGWGVAASICSAM